MASRFFASTNMVGRCSLSAYAELTALFLGVREKILQLYEADRISENG